jgi:uncharacterized protein YjbK
MASEFTFEVTVKAKPVHSDKTVDLFALEDGIREEIEETLPVVVSFKDGHNDDIDYDLDFEVKSVEKASQ